jgi:hypothetical protein
MQSNAAIYLLSSRKKLLKKCLFNLYKNWNEKYDYPVHVHFFKKTYSNDFIKDIQNSISKNISFHKINYQLPKKLLEKDLYYNKTELRYVRESFSKDRVGYLHMCRFATNITSYGKIGCLNNSLKNYEMLMKIDDDSGFISKINFDLFDKLKNYPYVTGYTWNTFNYTHRETRIGLWDFYKYYLKKYKYTPKSIDLRNALKFDDESIMHRIKWSCGNLNLFNINKFIKSPWYEYLNELNNFSGDYKYRWGDIETITLFAYTHFDIPIYDLNLREKKLYINKIESPYSIMAPSPGHINNLHNNILKDYYHNIKFLLKKISIFLIKNIKGKNFKNYRD